MSINCKIEQPDESKNQMKYDSSGDSISIRSTQPLIKHLWKNFSFVVSYNNYNNRK